MSTIEVIKIKEAPRGTFLAFVDLFVPKMGLEIYGCSLFEKDGVKSLALPSKEYTNAEGQKKFASVIRFREKAHVDAFNATALKAIEEKLAEAHRAPPMPELDEGLPF